MKVISEVWFPDGTIKLLSELTPEEREAFVDRVNSLPAKQAGYEVSWEKKGA